MSRSTTATRDLVLAGGGHAHALVLAALARRPIPGVRVTLVNDGPQAVYSGMIPGFVAGQYEAHELRIDLRQLARRAKARFVDARVTRIAAPARTLETADGALLAYDVASLDVGSTVAGLDLPGVAPLALPVRPAAALVAAVPALLDAARATEGRGFRAMVVGGGPGGIELACALRARLAREGVVHGGVSLLEASHRLLPGLPRAASQAAARRCRALGIEVETGVRVVAAEPGRLLLDGGGERGFDALLWCTGAAAHPLARASSLPLDARGFVLLEASLQVTGEPQLFAAGDLASLDSWPLAPKAGVYAVRAAPVLAHNLRARLAGAPLVPFRPRRDFLRLLNTGDGRAIGLKRGLVLEGRLVFCLKDWIDRRFVAGLRAGTTDPGDVPGRRGSDPTPGP